MTSALSAPASRSCAGSAPAFGDRRGYLDALLRLVYRLIFLFVAESRDLLLRPDAEATTTERYRLFYSLSRLRALADAAGFDRPAAVRNVAQIAPQAEILDVSARTGAASARRSILARSAGSASGHGSSHTRVPSMDS